MKYPTTGTLSRCPGCDEVSSTRIADCAHDWYAGARWRCPHCRGVFDADRWEDVKPWKPEPVMHGDHI